MFEFHELIGNILRNAVNSGELSSCHLKLAPECGGTSGLVQLFCRAQASNSTKCCWVDALLIHESRAKVIIEIEESGKSKSDP